jgi:RimJ/RimL family protein N-acetyltransferase
MQALAAGKPPTLPRATLRAPMPGDLSMLFALRRDLDLQSLVLTVPDGVDEAALQAWLQRRLAEPAGLFRVIVDSDRQMAIGYVQIAQVHRQNRTGYGGLVLAEAARGRHFGRAALNLLMHHGRVELGLRKLLAEVRADNAPSLRLHQSAGYRLVGTLRNHFTDARGLNHDVALLECALDGGATP